jgi:hypothetical protein
VSCLYFFDGINLSIVYLSFFKLFQRSLHQSTPPESPRQHPFHKKTQKYKNTKKPLKIWLLSGFFGPFKPVPNPRNILWVSGLGRVGRPVVKQHRKTAKT